MLTKTLILSLLRVIGATVFKGHDISTMPGYLMTGVWLGLSWQEAGRLCDS